MDWETAKELDNAVTPLIFSSQEEFSYPFFTAPTEREVKPPSIYDSSATTSTTDADISSSTMMMEHGIEEELASAGDDLRQLAFSIASRRTSSVQEWCQVVAPQIGGI
jgi:hypothetical protein